MSDAPGTTPPELPGQSSQPQYASEPSAPRSGGCGKVAGIGCLVFVLLIVIAGVVLWTQSRGWFAETARLMSDDMLKNLDLTPEQSDSVREKITSFIDDFENEKVSWTQLKSAAEHVMQGPLSCKIYDEGVVQPSGLSEEEKATGSRTMQRLARGLRENLVSTEVLAHMAEHQGSGPNGQHTDEEVRSGLAEFKAIADEASIPDEAFEIDIAAEIEAAIDEARASDE